MSRVQLQWSEAEVREGRLRVPLEPAPEKEWARRFEGTAALLDRGAFGELELKKGTVRVGPLEPGSEEKLRHFLESVVQEANGPEAAAEAAEEREQPEDAGEDHRPDADREMTTRFQGFAAASPEQGKDPQVPDEPE